MREREFNHKCISAYENRLNTCRSRWHTILYFEDHLYEYDAINKMINPFNGIKWYKLDDRFKNASDWLFDHRKGDKLNMVATNVNDTIVAIDVGLIENFISVEEYKEFKAYLENIYNNWNDFWKFALNEYPDLSKLL